MSHGSDNPRKEQCGCENCIPPERTYTAAEVAELKAPMECGHPRACETFDGLVRDKEGRVHRCAICVEVSTLKAQCAATLREVILPLRAVLTAKRVRYITIDAASDAIHAIIPTDYAAALAEHDEQLRQKFSKECARFHEEGRKCATCGREDIEELKAQCAAMLQKAAKATQESKRITRRI